MVRWLALACFGLAGAVSPAPTFAQAANTGPAAAATLREPLTVAPEREGYAFDRPRILAQQRLLGVAHGVSLLASACMDVPAHIDATLAVYLPWRADQEKAITQAERELARHYFGTRANEARWTDLLQALKLKNQLDLAPGSSELAAACETLPAALVRARYALERQLRLQGLLAEVTMGIEAELRRDWCRKNLDGLPRDVFEVRYETWREINVPRIEQAAAALKVEWPVEGPAESLAQWEAELRGDVTVRGSVADCMGFSESLKRPQAALRLLFAPATEGTP